MRAFTYKDKDIIDGDFHPKDNMLLLKKIEEMRRYLCWRLYLQALRQDWHC